MIVNGYKIEPYADLQKVDFTDANLSSAYLFRVNFTESNLSRADLGGAKFYYADLTGANLSGAKMYNVNLYGATGIVQLNMTQRMLYANMRQDEDGEWYCHVYNGCWNDGRGGTIDQLEEAVTQEYGDDSHYHVLEIPYLRAWEKLELKRLQEIE